MVTLLPRTRINDRAWNRCVADSGQRIVYGYSWYLDAVLPAPNWKWAGLVLADGPDAYRAVMPIPLRRKRTRWVVHQPLFCQCLGIFSPEEVDETPFLRLMQQQYRYGSVFRLNRQPATSLAFDSISTQTTHVLDLTLGYDAVYRGYHRDRKLNLRRAGAAGWTLIDATDPEPLLKLFRDNHAAGIPGGVGDWAYTIFRKLYYELRQRSLVTLRYAMLGQRIEAGVLFVQEGNRLIYLFNAASETGRRGNARTLLIDQIIREWAGKPCIIDFESPEKPAVVDFYRSFGAVEEPFWSVRWNRLGWLENQVRLLLTRHRK